MFSIKLKDLPPLTQADHEQHAVRAASPVSRTEHSDIPELTVEDKKERSSGKH